MSRTFSTLSRFPTLRSAQISPRAFSTSSSVQAGFIIKQVPYSVDEAGLKAFIASAGITADVTWPSLPDRKNLGRPYYWHTAYMRTADEDIARVMALDGEELGGRQLEIKHLMYETVKASRLPWGDAMNEWVRNPVGGEDQPPKMRPSLE